MFQPEILYEEPQEDQKYNFPFVQLARGQEMPRLLYIYESRETDEKQSGPEGESYPVMQWEMHQYADMLVLKEKLSEEVFDLVRVALGLDPMHIALEKSRKNSQNGENNLE